MRQPDRRCRFHGSAFGAAAVGLLACMMAGCYGSGGEAAVLAAEDYPTSPVLNRLVGSWSVEGSSLSEKGERVAWTGSATGTVDKACFLRLDVRVQVPGNGETIQGTSVFGQDGGRLLTMTSTYSSSPELRVYRGELDQNGGVITLTQVVRSSEPARRLVFRVVSNDQWTAEAWNESGERAAGRAEESMTFRRVP